MGLLQKNTTSAFGLWPPSLVILLTLFKPWERSNAGRTSCSKKGTMKEKENQLKTQERVSRRTGWCPHTLLTGWACNSSRSAWDRNLESVQCSATSACSTADSTHGKAVEGNTFSAEPFRGVLGSRCFPAWRRHWDRMEGGHFWHVEKNRPLQRKTMPSGLHLMALF